MKPTMPPPTIKRLSLYLQTLYLLKKEGQDIFSSEELGRRADVKANQIRKDLSYFGHFGRKGIGYSVQGLTREIEQIIGMHDSLSMIVVGLGHLGWALINYKIYADRGVRLQAIFDVDPNKVGKKVNNIPVYHVDEMPNFLLNNPIHIWVIVVPEREAQGVADLLIAGGVKGIWNFVPHTIKVPRTVWLVNEDLASSLSRLSYYISNSDTYLTCSEDSQRFDKASNN